MLIDAGILLIVVVGIVAFFKRPGRSSPGEVDAGGAGFGVVAWDAQRIFIYALSFAGLVATLYAIAGLAATIVVTLVQHSNVLAGSSGQRDRTSYYLASLIVGLPIWLALWQRAQRRVARSAEERQARERKWYLAAIFAVTSAVALFGLQTIVSDLLTLPDIGDATITVRDAVFAGARVLVWGIAWLIYARLGWTERSPRDLDEAHDLAVYVLTGFALVFFVVGLDGAIWQIVDGLTMPSVALHLSGDFGRTWGDVAAWTLAGGAVWAAIWRYDLARGGRRTFRVIYLYLVLAVAASATIGAGVDGLHEILRRAFGYHTTPMWDFLREVLPALLIGGTVWAYHWAIVRRQAALSDEAPGAIPWPRHLAIAMLDLAGLVVAAVAITSLLWLGLDALLHTGGAHSSGVWWRDRLSVGVAAGVIGSIIWLSAWTIWQRAAVADPVRERTLQIRRRLLGLIVLAGALVALGFAVALVWTIVRAVLDGTANANTVSQSLQDLLAAIMAAGFGLYHAVILREDRRVELPQPRRLRVLAFVEPGAESMVADLQRSAHTINLAGRLLREGAAVSDVARLDDELGRLDAQGQAEGALLILHADGATVYPYAKASIVAPACAVEAYRPASVAVGEGVEDGVTTPA